MSGRAVRVVARSVVAVGSIAAAVLGTSCRDVASRGDANPSASVPAQQSATAQSGAPVSALQVPVANSRDCDQQPPNTIREDEVPTLQGVHETASLLEWFAAHGVPENAVLDWLIAHHGRVPGINRDWAKGYLASGTAYVLRVGAPAEDAILHEYSIHKPEMFVHGAIFVARGGRPEAVLDVGLGTQAMDFPEVRGLDLALAVAADGLSVTLSDRARDGTRLIEARSTCERRKLLCAECERGDAAADMGCVMDTTRDQQPRCLDTWQTKDMIGRYPAELHDCAGAISRRQALIRGGMPDEAAMEREPLAFVTRSCAQRGRWSWRGGRFVQDKR